MEGRKSLPGPPKTGQAHSTWNKRKNFLGVLEKKGSERENRKEDRGRNLE